MGNGQKILVEFVCSGNSGRSPIAELFGRNHLTRLGLRDRLDTTSSGIWVRDMELRAVPDNANLVTGIVSKALQRGDVYKSHEKANLGAFLEREDFRWCDFKKDWFWRAVDKFQAEELAFRGRFLEEFGIQGEIKKSFTQTVPIDDVAAVFGMEPKHVKFVNEIYAGKEKRPFVAVLPRYAMMGDSSSDFALANGFGGTREEYFANSFRIKALVPKAIDRLLMDNTLAFKI